MIATRLDWAGSQVGKTRRLSNPDRTLKRMPIHSGSSWFRETLHKLPFVFGRSGDNVVLLSVASKGGSIVISQILHHDVIGGKMFFDS
jgi:hypothetical protein